MDQKKIVAGIGARAGREAYEAVISEDDKRTNPAIINIFVGLAIVLFIVGNQAMRVIFRTNFGREALYGMLVNISSLAFIGWGVVTYFESERLLGTQEIEESGGELSFIFTTVFYIILGILVFFIGRKESREAATHPDPNYPGDSLLLDFLENSGWSQRQVQYYAEPLCLLAVTLIFLSINTYLGLPLLFCFFSLVISNLIVGVAPNRIKTGVSNSNDFSTVTE